MLNMTLEAIKYEEGRLDILNQLLLPAQSIYERVASVEEAWDAIRVMKVFTECFLHPLGSAW